MIPKVIHYCWFGGNPLPKSVLRCIESWRHYFPAFEIREWNETNYDVMKIPYIAEAYRAKKYAFVSDYARFDILYQFGGVYFDTDVEVIKSFDDILINGAFMGFETDCVNVNPGLGIAAAPGLDIYREILDYYSTQHFLNIDGSINTETVVTKTTKLLVKHGLQDKTGIQQVAGINIYPREYFNPMDNNTGKMLKTVKTHSIHWYSMSWMPKRQFVIRKVTRVFHRIFGVECFSSVKKLRNKK